METETLSKRELLAGMIAQGIFANPRFFENTEGNDEHWAIVLSVENADALLAALAKTAPKPEPTQHLRPLPDGVPEPPEGAVYLGRGGEFWVRGTFQGFARAISRADNDWLEHKEWGGDSPCSYYAAPADSEIVALNRKEAGHGN